MLKRSLAAAAACLLLLAGCGGHTSHKPVGKPAAKLTLAPPRPTTAVPAYAAACPQAANGHGQPGICAPQSSVGRGPGPSRLGPGLTLFADLSNNDPCYCGATLKAQGYQGLIVKVNQGVGFIDWTASAMVKSARAAGLPVGGYDFDQDYTIAEAQVFASHLHTLGIDPKTTNTFPAYLDVEYGAFSYTGLVAQINYLRGLGYRVGIYTGSWYWTPHAGCRWPSGLVSAWLSGYPNAIVPCGVTGFNVHQFTSTPFDKDAQFGGSFAAFVNAPAPVPPKPARVVCFGKGALSTPGCRFVQREVSAWRKQAASDLANAARVTKRWS